MEPIYYDELDTPIGPLVLCASKKGLCNIEFGSFVQTETRLRSWLDKHFNSNRLIADAHALEIARIQLNQYFSGDRVQFDLPIHLQGTLFQIKVWNALTAIPYGETRSYKQIGEAIGAPKAVRAVGGANNRNPLPLIVPCHRVIGASGDMVGYGGGLPIKQFLLTLEGCLK
jgi:O-6-methylguanine DNA methyltransferase